MSILAFAAAAAILAVQNPAPRDPQTAAQPPLASVPAPQPTPAQLRSRYRAQAQQVCSRRAPTGRRIEQSTCISREMAAAQARAGQDELDRVTLQNGWQKESGD